jgi:hypothetical protein
MSDDEMYDEDMIMSVPLPPRTPFIIPQPFAGSLSDLQEIALESLDHTSLLIQKHFTGPDLDCYHGSSNGLFNSPYHAKLNSLLQMYVQAIDKTIREKEALLFDIGRDIWLDFDLIIFSKHAFAYATILRLQMLTNPSEAENPRVRLMLDHVVLLGLACQYSWIPNLYCHPTNHINMPQMSKFLVKMRSDSGLVGCIDKHNGCNCLSSLLESLPKTETCFSCEKQVTRGGMLKCSKCKIVWFCDKTCQKKDWYVFSTNNAALVSFPCNSPYICFTRAAGSNTNYNVVKLHPPPNSKFLWSTKSMTGRSLFLDSNPMNIVDRIYVVSLYDIVTCDVHGDPGSGTISRLYIFLPPIPDADS